MYSNIQPPQEDNNIKMQDIICVIINSKERDPKSYLAQTGYFPSNIPKGNKISLFSTTMSQATYTPLPLKKRQGADISKSWMDTYTSSHLHGGVTNLHTFPTIV